MLSNFNMPTTSGSMKRVALIASAVLCVFLPLVIGAPANDDILKQQIAAGLLRGDDFWSSLNQGRLYEGFPLRRPWVPQQTYQKRFDSLSGDAFGFAKRNFDEIDRVGLGFKRSFDEGRRGPTKKNFDEIDRIDGFGSFVKRSV